MKNKFLKRLAVLLSIIVIYSACKKDYIVGGGAIENVNYYKDSTTYDVLNGNSAYDTLIQLIDAAGFKDKINEQGATYFAPSDKAIFNYLNQRTIYVQNNINQDSIFGLDSLKYYLRNNINGTKDSMLMYLIPTSLPYSAMTNAGKLYATELEGDTAIVSYEFTSDPNLGYNPVVSSQPQIVYFTQLWHHYDLNDINTAGAVPNNIGVHTLVKTSGIKTKNGILNLLDNSNPLFFYNTKQ